MTECKIEPNTRQDSSVDSYLYTCTTCKEQRRYAYPEMGEGVFCDGLDWRTDVLQDVGGKVHLENLALKFGEQVADVEFLTYFKDKKQGQMVLERDDYANGAKVDLVAKLKLLTRAGLIELAKQDEQVVRYKQMAIKDNKAEMVKLTKVYGFDYYKLTDAGLKLLNQKYGDVIK